MGNTEDIKKACEGCPGCSATNSEETASGCSGCGCGICCGRVKVYDLYDSEVVASFDPEDLD